MLTGVDLLGFGMAPGEKTGARHQAKRNVTAKIGKPPGIKPTRLQGVNLLGFGPKTGKAPEGDLNQPGRSVRAKVGKPPIPEPSKPSI